MRYLVIGVLIAIFAAACGSLPQGTTLADLPAGDAARGAELFSQSVSGAPECSSCHTLDGQPLVGPSMQGFGARASTRVAGETAAQYAYHSITQPTVHVVSGFANTMYTQYGRQLSAQQTADLIAYLLTL